MNDLEKKILYERVADAGGLSPAEREELAGDPGLSEHIGGNAALRGLAECAPDSPGREAMLAAVYSRAKNHKEDFVAMFSGIFVRNKWYLSAGFALVLIAAALAIGMSRPGPAFAQSDGWVLEYRFGKVADENASPETVYKPVLDQAEKALHELAQSKRPAGETEYKPKIMFNVTVDNGEMTMVVAVVADNLISLDDVKSALSGIPGLPEPTVTDSTWYTENGAGFAGLLTVNLNNHIFNFPVNATEAEIESAINAWLAEHKPGANAQVEVTITTETGENGEQKKRIEVRIKIVDKDEKQ